MPKRLAIFARDELLDLIDSAFAKAADHDPAKADQYRLVGPHVRDVVARLYSGKRHERSGVSIELPELTKASEGPAPVGMRRAP